MRGPLSSPREERAGERWGEAFPSPVLVGADLRVRPRPEGTPRGIKGEGERSLTFRYLSAHGAKPWGIENRRRARGPVRNAF